MTGLYNVSDEMILGRAVKSLDRLAPICAIKQNLFSSYSTGREIT